MDNRTAEVEGVQVPRPPGNGIHLRKKAIHLREFN